MQRSPREVPLPIPMGVQNEVKGERHHAMSHQRSELVHILRPREMDVADTPSPRE
jgi:hypothetical protein